MIIRKTYSVALSLDSDPRVRLAGFIRIEADEVNFALPKSGALSISGKLPNGPRDLIPDDWSEWSRSLSVPGAEDGTITIGIEGKSIAVTAFIVPDASWSILTGYGIVYAQLGGRTISSRVNIRGSLQASENISQPPSPAPAPTPRAFRLEKIAEGKADWKCSGLGILPDGKWLLGEYNNISRHDIAVRVEGQSKLAWSDGSSETIDSPTFNEDDVQRMNQGLACGVSSVENGRPVSWVKSNGDWKGVPFPFELRFSAQSLFGMAGEPIFFDSEREQHPTIRDARGEVIHRFAAGKGIPFMAANVGGAYAITLCDHAQRGITLSNGLYFPTAQEPRVIIPFGSRILVGAGPQLYTLTRDGLVEFETDGIFAPSIDDAVPGENGSIWLVTSGDGIFLMNPDGSIGWSATLPDNHQKTGLFGSRVAHRDGRTLFVRNNQNRQNRWELFEVLPV